MCFRVPSRQGKYIFTQESVCLQGILNGIYEQDTSFINCTHKQMINNGAQPDKFGVLHCLLNIEFYALQAKLISKDY